MKGGLPPTTKPPCLRTKTNKTPTNQNLRQLPYYGVEPCSFPAQLLFKLIGYLTKTCLQIDLLPTLVYQSSVNFLPNPSFASQKNNHTP